MVSNHGFLHGCKWINIEKIQDNFETINEEFCYKQSRFCQI